MRSNVPRAILPYDRMRSRSAPSTATARFHTLRAKILPIAHAHGARNVRVFGSFARGDQRTSSDIDLLVELPKRASLIDLVGLKLDLEDSLGRKVDIVTDDGLSPYLRDRILREAHSL